MTLSFRNLVFSILLVFAVMAASAPRATAQHAGLTVVRDTEIEAILKEWSDPLIRAAGLRPGAVNLILVQSDAVNAFVAGGPNIFIFTGLLEKSENAGEVAGVIAHELGHISGGHLIRMRQAYENASYESLLGALLGIGVAIATGEGGAGAAISAGSQSMAARRFLSHSRVQESSADQAALSYIDHAGLGADGLVTFLDKLGDQELLPERQQSEYVRTHPLSRSRVDALKRGAAEIGAKQQSYPARWDDQHARMKAKLMGFLQPEQVVWHYGDSDKSIAARYARAIAAYRLNRVDEALERIDALAAAEPDNPYFHELKGQMLRDFGRLGEALASYSSALDRLASAPLIQIDYAHALMETAGSDEAQIRKAIGLLGEAQEKEPRNSRIQRLLATAHGRLGNEPMAKLHLAEEALLQSRLDFAETQATAAKRGLKEGSAEWLRANDILAFIALERE